MSLPVVWHEAYEVDLGDHVFVTAKYRLVKERLLAEGLVGASHVVRPEPASDQDILRVHTPGYVRKLRSGSLDSHERLALEVPFSPALREAAWICCGGTRAAAELALGRTPSVALHLGGGFHHAFPDHGEGFCLVNDVAVAVRRLRSDGIARRALVVDLDVHHGNGTAAIFADDPDVFTLSMHQARNYPAVKPPSDLDIGLEDRAGDREYLALVEEHLPRVVDAHRPEVAFYLAGADPYREDRLGGLRLSMEGLRRRDEVVLRTLAEAGAATAVLLAGGYAWRLRDTVEIHCGTARAAAAVRGGPG